MSEWIQHLGLCPIKNLIGIPCPGCGMTRAFLSLFNLDLKAAFDFHPLFWLVPLIFLVVLFRKRVPFFMQLYQNKWLAISLIFLFSGVYLVRLFLYFPAVVPMDFNSYALLPSLLRFIF